MGTGTQSYIIAEIVKAALAWVAEFLTGLYQKFKAKKEDESENQEVREGIENADTDEELQDALNRAGRDLPKP